MRLYVGVCLCFNVPRVCVSCTYDHAGMHICMSVNTLVPNLFYLLNYHFVKISQVTFEKRVYIFEYIARQNQYLIFKPFFSNYVMITDKSFLLHINYSINSQTFTIFILRVYVLCRFNNYFSP